MNTVTEKQAKDKSREITGNKYAKSCSASLPIKIKQQVDLCMSVRFKRFLHRSEWRGHRQTGITGGGLKAALHLPEGTLCSHRKRSTGADHARTHTSTTDRHADIYVKAHYLRTAASWQRHMAHTAKKERNWTIKCWIRTSKGRKMSGRWTRNKGQGQGKNCLIIGNCPPPPAISASESGNGSENGSALADSRGRFASPFLFALFSISS